MLNWIKRLFCKHNWKKLGWHYTENGANKVFRYECQTCKALSWAAMNSEKKKRLDKLCKAQNIEGQKGGNRMEEYWIGVDL